MTNNRQAQETEGFSEKFWDTFWKWWLRIGCLLILILLAMIGGCIYDVLKAIGG